MPSAITATANSEWNHLRHLTSCAPLQDFGKITAIASGANHGLCVARGQTVAAWGWQRRRWSTGSGADTNSERYFVDVSGLTNIIAHCRR